MLKKILDFLGGIAVHDYVFGVLLIVLFVFLYFKSPTIGRSTTVATESEEPAGTEEDFVSTYFDLVFAVSVTDDYASGNRKREIIFSHEIYLPYEETKASEHRDYNHPFYVESYDLCEVKVEKKNGKETVTLIRNLTKEQLNQTPCYWEEDRSDLD